MPAIIDSAPDCVASVAGAKPADDSADFILQAAYDKCAGFMTFGPGTTYGEDGAGAATQPQPVRVQPTVLPVHPVDEDGHRDDDPDPGQHVVRRRGAGAAVAVRRAGAERHEPGALLVGLLQHEVG